jgi:DNA-binding beta-propeller fold protein YncE
VTGSGGDGLALRPDGTKMFVTVDCKRELQVIETATGAILRHAHFQIDGAKRKQIGVGTLAEFSAAPSIPVSAFTR